MKKKLELQVQVQVQVEDIDTDIVISEKDLEIFKAVAQAWHSHSGGCRPTNEFDAYRRNFRGKPSRFKLEAMAKPSVKANASHRHHWDFGQSLWDSYEIVTMAKKLETGLVFDDPLTDASSRAQMKRKESKNSLRNLFKRVTSRRFNEADIPRQDKNEF